MRIVIPMAGMGKRMRPHTLTTPKPLIPIAGKPMVHVYNNGEPGNNFESVEGDLEDVFFAHIKGAVEA